jgi:cell division ATPase FtsA
LDIEEFESVLVELLNEFNKKLGGNFLDEVVIGISHPDMLFTRMKEFKRVMTANITVDDVTHLSKVLSDISVQPNYETLKIIPVERVIDDHIRLKDPVGMQGTKLEVVADIFALPKNFYQHLLDIINKLDLNIIDIVPNIL